MMMHVQPVEEPSNAFSASSAQGKRDYQEDAVATQEFIVEHAPPHSNDDDDDGQERTAKRWTFLGVFDGHSSSKKKKTGRGGGQVSKLATTLLPGLLARELRNLPATPKPERLANAIRDAFVRFDSHLQKLSIQEVSSVFGLLPPPRSDSAAKPISFDRAGSCACVCLLGDDYVSIANLGDSQCVIGCPKMEGAKDGVAFVTPVHQCSNANERRRIAAAGGFVVENRVGGILIPTRGFGDFRFKSSSVNGTNNKNSKGVEEEEQEATMMKSESESPARTAERAREVVMCVPEIFVFSRAELDDRKCDWLMIGSDGIFEVLSPSGVMDIIRGAGGTSGEEEEEGSGGGGVKTAVDPSAAADRVVRKAIEAGSRDNCTVVVMRLREGTECEKRVGFKRHHRHDEEEEHDDQQETTTTTKKKKKKKKRNEES